MGMLDDLLGQDSARSNALYGRGTDLVNEGTFGMDRAVKGLTGKGGPLDFWKSILGGDRTKAMSVLTPVTGTISSQFQAARKAAAENAGRTGGRASTLETSPFDEAAKEQDVLSSFYGEAPGQIANIDKMLAGIGVNRAEIGLGEEQGAVSYAGQGITGKLQQQELSNQTNQGIGQGLGAIMAVVLSKLLPATAAACWIAEAIYGVDAWETYLLRSWLNREFKRHLFGKLVMGLYCRYGQRVARLVKTYPRVRAAVAPLFNYALNCAINDRFEEFCQEEAWAAHS